MAKPKGTDIVGWSRHPAAAKDIVVLAEIDVDQRRRRKAGEFETWSHGHTVRQLGIARFEHPAAGTYRPVDLPPTYFIYTHSQVSNGNPYMYRPPAFIGANRDDLTWLWLEIGKELFSGEEE